MKLSKYLADYIEHELEETSIIEVIGDLHYIIQQGIEAFVSTQKNISVSIDIWKRCECGRLCKAE